MNRYFDKYRLVYCYPLFNTKNSNYIFMGEHKTYRCSEEDGKTECELVKTETSCEDKVTFITQDDSCGCEE